MESHDTMSWRLVAGVGLGFGTLGYVLVFRDNESDEMKQLREEDRKKLLVALDSSIAAAAGDTPVMPGVESLLTNLLHAMQLHLPRSDPTIAASCALLKDSAEARLRADIDRTARADSLRTTQGEAECTTPPTPPPSDDQSQLAAMYSDGARLSRSVLVAKDCWIAYPSKRLGFLPWFAVPTVQIDPDLIRSGEELLAVMEKGRSREGAAAIFRMARDCVPGYLVSMVLGFFQVQVEQRIFAMFPNMIDAADEGGLQGVHDQVLRIVLTFCISRMLEIASSTTSELVTSQFTCNLRTKLIQCCLGQDLEFFDKQTSNLSDNITSDVTAVRESLFDAPIEVLQSVTRILISSSQIYMASPKLFIPCLVPLPIAFVVASALYSLMPQDDGSGGSDIDPLRCIRTVREHVMEVEEGRKRGIKAREHRRTTLRSNFFQSCMTTLLYSVLGSQMLGMYYQGCRMYLRKEVPGSALQTLTMSAMTVCGSVPALMASGAALWEAMRPINRLADILDSKPRIEPRGLQFLAKKLRATHEDVFGQPSAAATPPPADAAASTEGDEGAPAPAPAAAPIPSIRFENVTFRYPVWGDGSKATEEGDHVLKDVSFEAYPGQNIALVGGVGSGKSTVLKLIERLYDASAGKVEMYGRDIGERDVHSIRDRMAVVAQDSVLIGSTIKEALCYGLPVTPTDAEVKEACVSTGSWGFISDLKDGVHSRINCLGGAKLSGGQKQCLSVTRAALRKPSILLLDEATSSLDSVSEKLVQTGIDQILSNTEASNAANRTTISVAHRLQTIVESDVIVVLHQGTVVEKGSHSELMNINVEVSVTGQLVTGFYRTLYEAQMRGSASSSNPSSDVKQRVAELEKENLRLRTRLQTGASGPPAETLPASEE